MYYDLFGHFNDSIILRYLEKCVQQPPDNELSSRYPTRISENTMSTVVNEKTQEEPDVDNFER